VQDVAFHKKCGIAVADMVKSQWVYRRLRNFRAGIEAGISVFKRAYGGARCIWRGPWQAIGRRRSLRPPAIGMVSRGAEGLQTPRWRETDSNHRSLVQ
jgi:hypothetical protein